MRFKNVIFSIALLGFAASMGTMLTGCQKETPLEVISQEEDHAYSTVLTLRDETGESSAELELFANTLEDFSALKKSQYELSVLTEIEGDETLPMLPGQEEAPLDQSSNNNEENIEQSEKGYRVLSTSLKEGVVGFQIQVLSRTPAITKGSCNYNANKWWYSQVPAKIQVNTAGCWIKCKYYNNGAYQYQKYIPPFNYRREASKWTKPSVRVYYPSGGSSITYYTVTFIL